MDRARALVLITAALAGGCSAKPSGASPGGAIDVENMPMRTEPDGTGEGELPFAQGRSFETLDSYLAFLRERGATGVPFYQEVRPGVYELISRRGPNAEPLFYTREELEEQFGFAR